MTQQTSHDTPPKVRSMQWWQKVARRIRVPLGFLTAAVYLVEVVRRAAASSRNRVESGAGFARAWRCARLHPARSRRTRNSR